MGNSWQEKVPSRRTDKIIHEYLPVSLTTSTHIPTQSEQPKTIIPVTALPPHPL